MQRAITLLGWVMIALSPLPWIALFALPFVGVNLGEGALAVIVLLLAAEALFFAGAALVAPALLKNRAKLFEMIRDRFRHDNP